VFLDYATEAGRASLPAGAAGVITVAEAAPPVKVLPWSAVGRSWGRELLPKPDLMMPAEPGLRLKDTPSIYGNDLSAPIAAGRAAADLSFRAKPR
jgi:hypothetical protein